MWGTPVDTVGIIVIVAIVAALIYAERTPRKR